MTGFVCQSFLKERRRPPTGGLREALEESLGKGFHALVPWSGVENDLGASVTRFPPAWGKTMDTAWNGMTPIGVVPVGASRLWGMERAD